MFFGKIPVWVYTAKNGYDWQGLDGGEEGATKTSLDKALGAAGKTAGAWGAVVRRPVASRRWAEWPRSRLCWVLFRFHPDAGRDQRGRACNYTAAACIPVGEKLPRLDFAKIFAAPEMAEVRTDGYGEMAIDLDGADYVLREPAGGGEGTEPSWDASWAVPELRREDALGTLSHWCQSEAVDRGDLKAVLREEVENGGELTAYITYAVFPQVAALQAAEEAYGAVAGQGAGAALREALAGWRKALAAVEDFNRALGGLAGLGLLMEERNRAWEEAAGAADAAERTARERAAAAASASAAAVELSRAIARFRFSADAEYGKEDNRRRLEELERTLAADRARHGEGGRWNELEARIDNLRQWAGIVEGDLDTVRTYRDVAERGGAGLAGLEAQARTALEQVRGLSQTGLGVFVSDALREMERLFGIAQAQKTPSKSMAPAAENGENVPPRAPKAAQSPVTYGYKVEGASKPDGNGRARDGGGHRRRDGWKRWWARWWEVVACVATILVTAATLGGIWGTMRRNALKEWSDIRASACKQAKAGSYSWAFRTLETLPPHKFLLLKRSWFGKELREGWAALAEVEGELRTEQNREASAKRDLEDLERAKKAKYLAKRIAAQDEWTAYETAREAAKKAREALEIGDDGLPVRWGEDSDRHPGVLTNLPARYADVVRGWGDAAWHLETAFRQIDATSAEELQAKQQKAEAEASAAAEEKARQEKERKLTIMERIGKELEAARAEEAAAKQKLEALETEKMPDKLIRIGKNYARVDWKRYEDHRKAAENRTRGIRFGSDALPYRELEGTPVHLGDDEMKGLPETYRAAAADWRQARDAFEKACKTIETGLGGDIWSLRVQYERMEKAKAKLQSLVNDPRYMAAQRDANAGGAWQEYSQTRKRAMELTKGLLFDADGLPVEIQGPLARNELPELRERCRQGATSFSEAYGKLEEAYRKLDEGMGEEADDVPEEAAETGEETSTDEKTEGDKPADADVPATEGGESGEAPALSQGHERGFWNKVASFVMGGDDDEPAPTAAPETRKKGGGATVPESKTSLPKEEVGSVSAASTAKAVAVPAEAPAAGVAGAEAAVGKGAERDGTDAGAVSASSEENAK